MRRFVRAMMEAAGSASGSGSAGERIPFPEDQADTDASGSASVSWSVSAIDDLPSIPLGMAITGEVHNDYITSDNSYNTVTPFGSLSGSSSMDVTVTDLDGDEFTGPLNLDGDGGLLSTFVSVDGSGNPSGTTVATWGGGYTLDNPHGGEGHDPPDVYGFGASVSVTQTFVGETIDLATLCTPEPVIFDPFESDAHASVGVTTVTLDREDGWSDESASGSGTTGATYVADGSTDLTNTLSFTNCARFINISGSTRAYDAYGYNEEGEYGYQYTATTSFTGRARMNPVARCGTYYGSYIGYGQISFSDTDIQEGRPTAVYMAVDGYLARGSVSKVGRLRCYIGEGGSITIDSSAGGTFKITDGVGVSGSISVSAPTSSAIKAAIESLPSFSGPQCIVRVYRYSPTTAGATGSGTFLTTAANGGSFTIHSTTAGGVTGGHGAGGSLDVMRFPFIYTGQCIEKSGQTWLNWVTSTPVFSRYNLACLSGSSISITKGARIAGIDDAFVYFCDCGPNCTAAPSALAGTLASPAVGANPAVAETMAIAKTTSEPCAYDVTWLTDEDGPGHANNWSVSIAVDAYGTFTAEIRDDEGSLMATFKANCFGGAVLPTLTWTLDSPPTGLLAPYTALTFGTA